MSVACLALSLLIVAAAPAHAVQGPLPSGPGSTSLVEGSNADGFPELALIRAAIEDGDRERAHVLLNALCVERAKVHASAVAEARVVEWLHALDELAGELGALQCQLEVRERLLLEQERVLDSDHPDVLRAKQSLAVTRYVLRDLPGAHELCEQVHAARERLLDPDHPDLLTAKQNLAATRKDLGDLHGALELEENVHAARERLLDPDHLDLLTAKQNLAVTRKDLGDLHGALELEENVHAARERLLDPDHPDLLTAKQNLAVTRATLGDLLGALELEEHVHAARTRLLDPDHPDLLIAKLNLAATRKDLGDLHGALELEENVHAARERLLDPDHPDLLTAKQNLAVTRATLGDLLGALELEEHVHAARTRLLDPDHSDLLAAKLNLAVTRKELGDLPGAAELFEDVHAAWERLLDPDHPDLLIAKLNLAVTRRLLGDLPGALELEEHVHAALERLLDPDHPELLAAKQNLAVTRATLGDLPGALELQEHVHAALERLLDPVHPSLLAAKQNLAATRAQLGDLPGALELQEHVHAARERLLDADNLDLLSAKTNLAATRAQLGDLPGALELEEHAHAAYERLIDPDHPSLLRAKQNLAVGRMQLGDLAGSLELCGQLAEGVATALARGLIVSPREAREMTLDAVRLLAKARTWSSSTMPTGHVSARYFAALETARHIAAARVGHARPLTHVDEMEIDRLRREVRAAVARMERHFARGPEFAERVEGTDEAKWRSQRDAAQDRWNRELARLALERDERQKEWRARVARSGHFVADIALDVVVAALEPGDLAVGVHKLECWEWFEAEDPLDGASQRFDRRHDGPHYIAYLVNLHGTVTEVDLGRAEALEGLARAWRSAIGAPLSGRGLGAAAASDTSGGEPAAGRALRRALLDPLLAAAELRPGHRVFICVDDALHTVPLDALPMDAGTAAPEGRVVEGDAVRVGDVYDIRTEVSFARLFAPERPAGGSDSLLVVGGVDYGALESGSTTDDVADPLEVRVLAKAGDERTGEWGSWAALPGSEEEASALAQLARGAQLEDAAQIGGGDVTTAKLEAAVRGKRYIHVATHGWFMPETVRSMLDEDPGDERLGLLGTDRTVTGFAPLALCGLVLSGANAAETPEVLSARLLTAMELASFDLRDCELAVLSACETNVGIARAGQGIQSLQTALHQAGARASLTSLWLVDDAATRDLMTAFYKNLWQEGMGKARALWEAKRALRARGAPPSHWAGWVLVGDPD